MAYTDLKEKLEQLLQEDISNRATLQETRRNLFLNSEGSKVQQQLIEQKQNEIASLNTLVEKKKTILQLKDDEIAVLRGTVQELVTKATEAGVSFEEEKKKWEATLAKLSGQLEESAGLGNKVAELSLQNDEYTAKIRELIYHIDNQNTETGQLKAEITSLKRTNAGLIQPQQLEEKNTEIENLKSELQTLKAIPVADPKELEEKNAEIESLKNELQALKAIPVADPKELEQKTAELEHAKEKADLLAESEQQLKMLVASQNNELEILHKQVNSYKRQVEDIASGWQHQQEQLLADNSNLLAELALLKEAATVIEQTPVSVVSEEQMASVQAEKEKLGTELQAAASELAALKESISHAPAPLTSATPEEVEAIKQEKERLCLELEATRHELDITTQQREEKIILLQAEIGALQNQVIALSDSLNRESEERSLIGTQLEQLQNIVAEKEQQLNHLADNQANEEFIDKLMFQTNRLNDEKHRFEMLYSESEAELTLTRTNLATLTQLIEEQKNSISSLQETDKHVKLAQTLMLQVSDKTAAKQAINELVREIDRCIALLSE